MLPGSGSIRPCFAVLTVLALPMQLNGVAGRLDGRGAAFGSGPGGGCCLLVAGEGAGEDGGAGSTLDSWLVVREKPHGNNARQVDTVATHTTVLPKSGEAATDWRLMPFVAAQTSGGVPGQPIPLSIVVTSPYGQPNPQYEAVTFVLIDNLPDGASLSRGQRSSDGAWKVPQEELSDLTLSVPPETAAPLTLLITAVTDHGGGVVARQAVTLAVPVSDTVAVADDSLASSAANTAADPPAQGGSSQGGPAQVMEAAKPDMAEPAVSGSSSPPVPPEPQAQEPQQSEPAVAEAPAPAPTADPPPAEVPAAVQTVAAPPPPPEPQVAAKAASPPATVAVAAVPAVAAPPPEPPRAEKREEVVHKPAKLPSNIPEATLMKRGDDLFAQGDLAGARLYYEMVAETGNAKAAFALGRTHDPLVHERLHVRGLPPDPEQAAAWYRRAVAAGSGDAEQQLKKLTDWLAGKSR
ncbi:hypothetical protein GBZ48_30435 [Azospirillum melinis]|uniref:Sel1 repeat family protein n=1 Tax=Azospirillum melinis TaxID=328839 RepID=A0ABX2KIW2_9PROT|nr:sel1 repeat family protein [Azospirillum melinis]MBP2309562.1 hypothetical protein [Azospirillum melinis]NUB03540.1 hypothetical protein [Azospirillum melinis]